MRRQSPYYQRIAGYFVDEELAVWRFIRDQGGYWSARQLLLKFPDFKDGRILGGVLTRFRNAHCLVIRERPTEMRKYGVTSACEAPMTETLDPTSGEAA